MTMDPNLQLIINIGAVALALTSVIGLIFAIAKLWPLLKRAVALGTSLEKLPEMALEISALTIGQRNQAETQREQGETLGEQSSSLATITDEVEKVKQQVKNDHDSNLREDLDEVRDHVVSLHGNVNELHTKLDAHLGQPSTTINVNPGSAA